MTAEREPLNLDVHDPEEWEGKYIDVGGARYTIGPQIGAGSSKVVHRLVNDRSGLSELALKIWRDPSAGGPEAAEGIRRLRGLTGMTTSTPSEVTFRAHGGCLQLQAYFGAPDTNPETSKLLDHAEELLLAAQAITSYGGAGELRLSRARAPLRRRTIDSLSLLDEQFGDPAGYRLDEYRSGKRESGGRPLRALTGRLRERLGGESALEQAMGYYQAVLRENPEHSEALHNAAGVCALAGDIEQARKLETRVVVIEPNYLPYLQACTYYAAAAGLPRHALAAFAQARDKFPYAHDQDGLACEAYLRCGEPERAAELLDSAGADEALRAAVAAAVRGHKAARELLEAGSRALTVGDTEASRRAVEQASREAPADLRVRANMALFKRADGGPAAALDELLEVHDLARPGTIGMHCLSTAAAFALEIGDLERAADLLDRAWRLMQAYHDDASPIDPDWIPGIAVFFHPDGTFERPMSAMAELLENAVRDREAEAPAALIEAYAAKYREAAALTE